MKNLIIVLALSWPGLSTMTEAQVVKGRQIVKAELLTDATDFTKPFTIGIRLTIEPGWYTYWKNPGDSGLPIEINWMLPKGWTADELRHPVPRKFVHDNTVSYGYEDEVVLLATVNPAGPSIQHVKARLDWLVCKESCVRGEATVSLDLNKAAGKENREPRSLAEYRQRLPKARGEALVVFGKAAAAMEGVGLKIEVPYETSTDLEFVDFYPGSVKGILMDFSTVRVENKILSFRGTPEGTGTGEIYLSGLLIGNDGAGYECSVPIRFRTRE